MKYFEGSRENFNTTANRNDVDDTDLFFADLSCRSEKSKLGVSPPISTTTASL